MLNWDFTCDPATAASLNLCSTHKCRKDVYFVLCDGEDTKRIGRIFWFTMPYLILNSPLLSWQNSSKKKEKKNISPCNDISMQNYDIVTQINRKPDLDLYK